MRDIEAMKMNLTALKNGEALGLFPEGTRKGLAKGAKVQNGAAYMALKTKTKVVPVGIQGTFKPFTKVKLNYGKPLDYTNYEPKNPEKEDIEKIIPQRDPFLMIDEVEEFVPGEMAIAYKNVNENEWYFKGHFPGNPIMPGVLITESLAQTGAVAILSLEENKGKNALFGGIDKLRFKKMVVPGDKLKLEVKIIKKKGPIGIGEGIATVDGKLAAKGEFTFAVV